jgi:outer membrane receptor protein involved in Fe transport
MKIFTRLAAVLTFFFLLTISAVSTWAQITTGDVIGTVTDSSGAVVPNAKVTITNTGTNIERSAPSGQNGDFAFNLLPPGKYTVRVESTGFKSFSVAAFDLAAGDRSRVDGHLEVGKATETVMVTGEVPQLQTDSSSLGTAITGRLVQDLPLNGRNYVQLTQLVPGVSAGPPNGLATGTRPDDRRLNSSFSVNGQDPIANNNMIDGMDNNERIIGTIGVRPSIDAIQEFKVQTNLYSAEIGRTSGGVVNIISKSGSNQFHGSLFEFLRNDRLDANGNFNFTGGAQLPKQKFRQNQFGGSVGGPIIKDKTFFFGDYEALKIRQGIPITATVPTAKQRIGDFSEPQDLPLVLTAANPIGGFAAKSVLPGNIMPDSLKDPLALKIASLYPLPTGSGVSKLNYASSPVRPQDATTFDTRVDHSFNQNWNLFGRYSFNDITTVQPTGFPDVGGINPGGLFAFAGANKTRAQNMQLNLVHTLKPNLLLELRAGYLRTAIQSKTINDGKNTATSLGFPCNAISCVNLGDEQTFGLPRILIQGFQELGDAVFVPLLQFDNTFQYSGGLTWTRGAHNIKFGASLIRRQYSIVQSSTSRGTFTFNASASNAPAPLNYGFANFLAGAPVTVQRVASLYKPGYRGWESGYYVQDDWRLTRWLTLNMGVRYDIFTAKTEQHNRMANFDPVNSAILVAGQNSSATTNISTDHGDFAPRFGFAATLGHGTVLRGGIGLSFYPGDYASGVALKNPPFTSALTCGTSTTQNFANNGCPAGIGTLAQGSPVPLGPTAFPTVSGGALDLTKIPPSTISAVDLNLQASYNLQFNFIVEKQFGSNVLSVGYVGSRGHRLSMALGDINRALPSGTSTPNPRPYAASAPRITTVAYFTSAGEAEYNALQISLNRRLAKGLSFTSGFTYAHGQDDVTGLGTSTGGYGNKIGPLSGAIDNVRSYDWATSDFDVKYRWSLGANYELPFVKSRKGLMGQAFGGWQTNGSVIWQTGLPFTVTDQQSVSGITGIGGERPDQVSSNIRAANPTVGANGQWLDPAAFALPTAFTLGNAVRNVGYGPRQSVINGSLFKTFDLTEKYHLQFRSELFNFVNHPIFGNPNTSFGNGNYGKILSTAGFYSPRQIQFALKLLF